jgi:L-fuconolactonase
MIDTHLHFWDLESYRHQQWFNDKPLLQRSWLPPDVKPEFDACGVASGVIVEAGKDDHALNLWWLALAEQYDYIGAAVLGCTLEHPNLPAWLDEYGQSSYFVGLRANPAGSPETWHENSATQRGLAELARRDLSLDLLVSYSAFADVGEIAAAYPTLRIILDHCAHPPMREGDLREWAAALEPLVAYPNIHIKYSSLLLYSYPDSEEARLRGVTDFLFARFGVERMMWGSNWPVELLGGSYRDALAAMQACAEPLSGEERQALFLDNAKRFYRVQMPGG